MVSTLEKMLQHASERLGAGKTTSRTELIPVFQRFVRVEDHRLRILHRGGAGGREVAQGRSRLLDVVVQKIFLDAKSVLGGKPDPDLPRVTLVALGGYGRGELNPFSDVDIMFLHDASPRNAAHGEFLSALVEAVLTILWDIGFKVGHCCRTIKESIQIANRDMQSKTSLIEARCLAGDTKLFDQFQESLYHESVQKSLDGYVEARLTDQVERHTKYGDTVFLQEPHVKNGCGGLRDFQNILWMAFFKYGTRDLKDLEKRGFISPSERRQLDVAYDFILRVRTELHTLAGRANDVIALSLQGKIANHFGYRQHDQLRRIEAFMRDYYLHASHVFLLTNALTQRLALKNPGLPEGRSLHAFLARRMAREEKKDGFRFRGTMMLASSPKIFADDPLRLMRVFRYAQVRHLDLAPDLRLLIRDHLALVDRKFLRDPHARDTFLGILAQKGEVSKILRLMHELGFLGKYMPEFGKLTCLVQHEFYHRYTADEHTLLTLQKLDETVGASSVPVANYGKMFHQVARPDLLYLALILHDTGRALNAAHHDQASARNAIRVADRWNLEAAEKDLLVFLVQHHVALSTTAQRRDLDDPEVIDEFVKLTASVPRLESLHLLTYADAQATGVNQQQWQEVLRWELYDKTRQQLSGSRDTAEEQEKRVEAAQAAVAEHVKNVVSGDEWQAHVDMMLRRYWLALDCAEICEHLLVIHELLERQALARDSRGALAPVVACKAEPDRGFTRVSICGWDRSRLFARIAGSFAVAGLNIVSAHIYTRRDDIALDTFHVTDASLGAVGNLQLLKLFEETLAESLNSSLNLEELIFRQPPPQLPFRPEATSVKTQVTVNNDNSSGRSIVEVQAEDQIGLLFVIANALSSMGLQISSAQISTEKGAALDAFYVVSQSGKKIVHPDQQREICRVTVAAIERLRLQSGKK